MVILRKPPLKYHIKFLLNGKNIFMSNNKDKTKKINNCNVHVMPPSITDTDITALFNGILNVIRKKVELDARAEILNMNLSIDKLQKNLKEKTAECNRLKNEIVFLKSQLSNENINKL